MIFHEVGLRWLYFGASDDLEFGLYEFSAFPVSSNNAVR